MNIDQEYLKGLLEAFEAADSPTTDIEELKSRNYDYRDVKFLFHIKLLEDQGLVRADAGNRLGYVRGADGIVSWSVVPLRLTAKGHEFIETLRNKDVWEAIKSNFKDASLGSLLNISKELFEGYLKKKISSLID
ncbi:MAG: DUF2513 domain-containing protein [Deltaproteobacteria bacterium]|nr:DUF2513 domain-containing protein [Deltaproteobacteria bacterium]